MSPGSPDASDELQVIPRRPSEGPPAPSPGSKPPPSEPGVTPAARERQKRLIGIVAVALGACAFILVAAGVLRATHPHDPAASGAPASASASASATAAPSASAAAAAPSSVASATLPPPAPAPAPTTGTVVFDKPATPGKVWIDGKKITAKSVDIPCGTHKIKIGSGKTKPVTITCGAEVHLTH
jgi:hypothetical protein